MSHASIEAGDDLPLTLPRLLAARAGDSRDFVVIDDDRLSYHEAERRSREVARALLGMGVGRGTHVGLLFPNGANFVVSCLAVMRIGAVAVPISTFSTPRELAQILRNASVRVLLAARAFRRNDFARTLGDALPEFAPDRMEPLWSTNAPALRHILFESNFPQSRQAKAGTDAAAPPRSISEELVSAAESDVSPSDPMVVIHTSGSTSAPKGVVHAHGAMIRHVDNLNQNRRYDADDVLFSNSPWFWVGGFAYTLLGTLVAGARLVCSNAEEPSELLDLLERERPTIVNGFAQSVAHLPHDPSFAARDLTSIRRGNLYPIMPEAVRPKDPELRHGMLGMTETGSVCLDAPDESDLPEAQRGSFGRPATGFETRVVSLDSGRTCDANEVGELQFRGAFLMEGYLGRERHEAFDADQWYATGDLVHVDAEGLFYFHGRSGSMIKTSGANVSPREVEAEISAVTGCTAYVVGLPDGERGQRVAAAIVSGTELDFDSIRASLRDRLSAYKVPRSFVRLREEDVPMLSSGKLDLRGLEKCFDGG